MDLDNEELQATKEISADTKKMCEYCNPNRAGKNLKVNKTHRLKIKSNSDNLNCFLLHDDEGTGLMIGTFEGYHYISINYCPMCRKGVADG